MNFICVICGSSPAFLCKGCTSCAYCSVACQETDFDLHKILCKKFTDFHADKRPTINDRRALYAPVQETRPRLVWVSITPNNPGWEGHDEPHLDSLLKVQAEDRGYIGRHATYIRGNTLRGRTENDHTIELWQRDDDIGPEPPINKSVSIFDGHAWSTWRGPLIAMSKAGTDFDPKSYIDCSLTDFRDFADFIHYFRPTIGSAIDGVGSQDRFGKLLLDQDRGKVQVIRLTCQKNANSGAVPVFSATSIPRTHPAFRHADDPPSIADFLATPVFAFREKTRQAQIQDRTKEGISDNPSITTLYCNVGYSWSSKMEGVGRTDDRWSNNVGNALVLRRDKQDVDIEYVRGLIELIRSRIQPQAIAWRLSGSRIEDLHVLIKNEINIFQAHRPEACTGSD